MGEAGVTMAFVGSAVEEARAREFPGYSAGGGLLQERLLGQLRQSGVQVGEVFSVRAVSSFPHVRRLWFRAESRRATNGTVVTQLPFVNLKVMRTISLGCSLFPRLLRWGRLHRRQPHRAVMVYNGVNPPAFVSLAAARVIHSKVFGFVADVQVPGAGLVEDNALRRMEFKLQVRSLRHFDGLVVVAPGIVEDFAPDVPFVVVDGGIPRAVVDEFSGQRATENTSVREAGRFVVMYAGGLSELAGVPLLLKAFALVPDARYRLWIAGAGPCRELVEEAATRDPRIEYLGVRENAEIRALYGRTAALVNPHSTRLQTARYVFPSKLIEYMASGTPVISTCLPGMDPRYGACTLTLREETPEALAALVQALARLDGRERRAMGQRAREFVLRERTWERQGQRVAEFITSMTVAGEAFPVQRSHEGRSS